MLHLPKKRPWLLLVLMYAVIIGVWTTYIMYARQRDTKLMTPKEAEQYYKDHPKQTTTLPQEKHDQTAR